MSGEIEPWRPEPAPPAWGRDGTDDLRDRAIAGARGQPAHESDLEPLDAYHAGWLARLFEPAEVEASDPHIGDDY